MTKLLVCVAVALLLVACGDSGAPVPGQGSRALVALKDGNAAVVQLADLTVSESVAPPMAISTDAVFRSGSGVVYVVNRFGFDNVTLLDDLDLTVLKQFSTGSGSNPQDLAALSETKVYVPLYTTGEILIADPTAADGAEELGRIDLSSIDPDPTPTSAVLVGSELFVALAFVDPATYAPKRDAVVAVIDTSTDTVTGQIDLHSKNPFARMQRVPGDPRLVVNGADDFGGTLGCFEVIDTTTRTAACVVDNATCGGWSGSLTVSPDGDVYAAVAAGFMVDGTLCHFTLDGTVVNGGIAVTGSLTDVALSVDGELYVVDTSDTGGVWVFDASTDTNLTAQPISLGAVPAFASGVLFLP